MKTFSYVCTYIQSKQKWYEKIEFIECFFSHSSDADRGMRAGGKEQ
jgi:hypothetical protein